MRDVPPIPRAPGHAPAADTAGPRRGDGYGYDIARSDPRAPAALGADAPAAPARRWPRWVRTVVWAVAFTGLSAIALGVWAIAICPIGIGTSLVAFTAALVPVGIVLSAVWWLDRYTPQPRVTLVFAFAWGAAMSVALALIVGLAVQVAMASSDTGEGASQFLGAVVQAPIVEESMKSAGLLALLIFGRRFISGPIDGVVYAILIAGGFAFTENILYFGRAFAESQAAGEASAFWQTFVLRGIMSPFAHACFTSLAGIGIGIAAERRSLPLYVGLGLGGLALGMCLHALWNGATFFLDVDPEAPLRSFLTYYGYIQVPIFLVLLGILVWLRLRERSIVRRHLSEYGRAGWFTPEEVEMMLSLRRRRQAERWAARSGAIVRIAMRDLIRGSVQLAMERHSVMHSRSTPRTRRAERELLERITSDRRLIGALSRPVARIAPSEGSERAREGARRVEQVAAPAT